MHALEVREARETDVVAIRDLFVRAYGLNYRYPQFYDDYWLKKTVFSDNYLFLTALAGEQIVGTASVYYDVGAYADLIGEFGRLVVDPDFRRRGVGNLLMEHRLRFAQQRLHFGLVHTRTAHPYAQRIAQQYNFQPVGFLPLVSMFNERESIAVMGQLFRAAHDLRRNHPRIIPEVFPLAAQALQNLGLPNDLLVIEDAESYPMNQEYAVAELSETGLPHLLRIERGRLTRRQVFGNLTLSYGYFALQAKEAQYLVARQGSTIVGAIGFVQDRVSKTIKIVELIDVDNAVAGFLLRELDRRARESADVAYVEVAVSAYWPHIQRTLDQLGFCPVAYCPAYVFRGMERLDAVRMAKLYIPLELGTCSLTPEVEAIYDKVMPKFNARRMGLAIEEFARSVTIFQGLTDAQLNSLAGICSVVRYPADEVVFRQGEVNQQLYLLVEGQVKICMGPDKAVVGRILPGDVLGEISLVQGQPHSATAVTTQDAKFIVLKHDEFAGLIQRYPRIGLTVMQNIARSLGGKLKQADIALLQTPIVDRGQE